MSQAVDLDHPRALDFLKEDAAHVNAFFRRAGIAVLNTRQLFDFAVDPSINESNLYEAVETLQQLAVRCTLPTSFFATDPVPTLAPTTAQKEPLAVSFPAHLMGAA